jgi:hypothetical protein
MIDAKSVDEAGAVVDTMPLSKETLVDHEYIPVGPLVPLAALIAKGPGHGNAVERSSRQSDRRIQDYKVGEVDMPAVSLLAVLYLDRNTVRDERRGNADAVASTPFFRSRPRGSP